MNQPISLEEERSDALYLLNLLERRNPENADAMNLGETMDAQDELNQIVEGMDRHFSEYCTDESITPSDDAFIDFVIENTFEYRKNRLLQTIEIYHALNIANQFATANPDHNLSEKFLSMADTTDIAVLRHYIEFDLTNARNHI